MQGWRRAAGATLALCGLAAVLPGCMVAVGSTTGSHAERRVQRLEERMKAAEQKLGLPGPEEVQK